MTGRVKLAVISAVAATFLGCAVAKNEPSGISAKSAKSVKSSIPSANPETMDKETRAIYNNWQELKKRHLRLIPVPKEIAFKGSAVELPGNVTIVLENKTKQGEIAANEIVSRVKELTGKDIPVIASPRDGAYNIIIENKWPNFFSKEEGKVKTQNPYCRKQAYRLEPIENGIKLAGNSPLGMMYAAVTLRYLIEKSGDKALLHPAKIIDWPDFPRRMIASFFATYHYKYRNNPKKHFAHMKKFMDWAFRLKINYISNHTYTPYYRTQSPFNDNLVVDEKIGKSAKLVSNYLAERGIGSFDGMDVALAQPKDKDQPGVKDMLYNSVHKKWYSWARHDLHKKKAELLGTLFSKMGMSMVNVHSIDGGGFRDPELWSERDKLTREKYGDNRGQANLDMLNIYIDTFKKKGMDTRLVIYPYSGLYIKEEFGLKKLGLADSPANRKMVKNQIAKIKNVMRKLNDSLPKDIPLCVREGKRSEVFNFYDMFPERAMSYSFYPQELNRDIMPLLSAELNTYWSGFSPDRKTNDITRLAMSRKFMEQSSVCSAEYTWNTKFPGWEDIDRTRNPVNYDQAVLDIMAERVAVGLWGDEAGQDLKDLFNGQLSFYLAYAPKESTARLNLKSLLPFLKNNYQASLKAEKAMDKVWSKVKNDKQIIDSFSYPIFVTYYKMLKAAVAYGVTNYYVELGESLARKGDIKGAEAAVEAGKKKLELAQKEYLKTMLGLKGEPELVTFDDLNGWWRRVPVHADSNLLNPDFKALAKKLDDLEKNKEAIFQQYNVPKWLGSFMKSKNLKAVKVSNGIVVDGKPDEEDWTNAASVEHFTGSKNLKMPPNAVVAKLLYDDRNIYLSGEVAQPLLSEFVENKDGKFDFSECVEFFLLPDKNKKENYFQLAVDAQGNLFSLKKEGSGINLKKTLDWKSGAKAAAIKGKEKWSFELAVPFEKLGKGADKDWRGMICYDGTEKLKPRKVVGAYASSNVEGQGFHNPDKFQNIQFVKSAGAPAVGLNITCVEPSSEGKTHESGSGSLISFGATLETKRPLYDVELKARFLDKNKKPVGEEMVLMKKKYLPLAWRATTPFRRQLMEFHKGIYLEFVATYKTSDGKAGKLEKYFIVGDKLGMLSKKNAFVEGVKKNFKAISCPFSFDVNSDAGAFLSPEKGSMEFWVKPELEVYDATASKKDGEALAHWGVLRPKSPLSRNKDAMSIVLMKKWGLINFQLANHKYETRSANAYIRDWKKGEWHHLAFVWDFTKEPIRMDIYVDGKLKSKGVKNKKGEKVSTAMETKSFPYSVQFGCLNSGAWSFPAAFDELRVSKTLFYSKDFTPARDASGEGVIFKFEDNFSSNNKVNAYQRCQ